MLQNWTCPWLPRRSDPPSFQSIVFYNIMAVCITPHLYELPRNKLLARRAGRWFSGLELHRDYTVNYTVKHLTISPNADYHCFCKPLAVPNAEYHCFDKLLSCPITEYCSFTTIWHARALNNIVFTSIWPSRALNEAPYRSHQQK